MSSRTVLLLASMAALAACGDSTPAADAATDATADAQADVRTMDAAADLPATDAPLHDAPTSDAPTSDAPTSDAPMTDAPISDAPSTDAPSTDAPMTDASDLVDCDPSHTVCDRIPPICTGGGEVASVTGTCWGPCVLYTRCRPIPCDPAAPSCPPALVCYRTTRLCGPPL